MEKWGQDHAHYPLNGETHLAVKAWLVKKASVAKMKFYTRARQNFLSETFNSLINNMRPSGSTMLSLTLHGLPALDLIGVKEGTELYWQRSKGKPVELQ